jgi:hypothetical protein
VVVATLTEVANAFAVRDCALLAAPAPACESVIVTTKSMPEPKLEVIVAEAFFWPFAVRLRELRYANSHVRFTSPL